MESFRRGWRGWILSSGGYSIRLMGRTRLQYRDDVGQLDIFAEPMSEPWLDIVVDLSSIPDRPERSRKEVVENLHRAFRFAGWTLIDAGRGEAGDR